MLELDVIISQQTELGETMPQAYSLDLRQRLIDAVEVGSSARAAARLAGCYILNLKIAIRIDLVDHQIFSRSNSRPGQGAKVAHLVMNLLLHDQLVLHIHRDLKL